jgi:hypothetical protein
VRPSRGEQPEASPREVHNPAEGWAKGPLTVITVVAVLAAAFFLADALDLVL